MFKKWLPLILVLVPFLVAAQEKNPSVLRVYIDCNYYCDFTYIKTNIDYIDFVPDQFSAQVQVIVTAQQTGSGGSAVQLYFRGLLAFSGLQDTLHFNRSSVDTDEEYRIQLVHYLKLGLTRYLARTEMARNINFTVKNETGQSSLNSSSQEKDPWNSWVFNAGFNMNLDGSDNYSSSNLRYRLTAARVTEKLKIYAGSYFSIEKNRFIYNEYNDSMGTLLSSDTTKSRNLRSDVNGTVAYSIGSHGSLGVFANYYQSSFSNIQKSFAIKAAIEFSFFPYKAATNKYLGFLYRVGPVYNDYNQPSWRNKEEECLWEQNISFDLHFTQKWGSVRTSLYWSNYFFDPRWNQYGCNGNGQFRIVKGLSFNFFYGISIIHNQVELPRGNATQTEVLIRQRMLKNTFSYYTGFGINYRFGSIYNNVVNPRLGEVNGSSF
jgi:hypothetical protein